MTTDIIMPGKEGRTWIGSAHDVEGPVDDGEAPYLIQVDFRFSDEALARDFIADFAEATAKSENGKSVYVRTIYGTTYRVPLTAEQRDLLLRMKEVGALPEGRIEEA